jgi:hypothetical protein
MSLPRTLLQDKCSGSEQGGSDSVFLSHRGLRARYTTKESKVATATIVATDKEAKTAVVIFIAALFYRLSFVLRTIDVCLQGIDNRKDE